MTQRKWSLDSGVIDFIKFFVTVLITGHLLACTFFLLPALWESSCVTVTEDGVDIPRGPYTDGADNQVSGNHHHHPQPGLPSCLPSLSCRADSGHN